MSAYLKLGSRLLILCVLVLIVVLSQPQPASAAGCFTCRSQCFSNERECSALCSGDPGCEDDCSAAGQACLQNCGC